MREFRKKRAGEYTREEFFDLQSLLVGISDAFRKLSSRIKSALSATRGRGQNLRDKASGYLKHLWSAATGACKSFVDSIRSIKDTNWRELTPK